MEKVGVNRERCDRKGTFFGRIGSGTAISTWTEIITVVLIATLAFGGIVTSMSSFYHVPASKNFTISSFDNDTTIISDAMTRLMLRGHNATTGGEVTQNSWGFNWLFTWTVISSMASIIWDFVTGQWMFTLLQTIFPQLTVKFVFTLTALVQAVLVIGIMFAIVRLVQKVKP